MLSALTLCVPRPTLPCSATLSISAHSFDLDSLSDQEGTAGKGHITNYAQNVNGTVWNLTMLKKHLGVWQGLCVVHQHSSQQIACPAYPLLTAPYSCPPA